MGAEERERIPQHIWTFVESELRTYPENLRLIQNFDLEYEGIINEGLVGVKDLASDRRAQYKNSDVVSAKVMRLVAMAEQVDRARHYTRAISSVLEALDPIDREIINLRYFVATHTNQGVANVLHISLREFYRRRRCLIGKFAKMMGLY